MDQQQFSFVSDLAALAAGSPFSTVALLATCDRSRSPKAGEYLRFEFSDRSGRFSAVMFSSHRQFAEMGAAAQGTVWIIAGRADTYDGGFSPTLVSLDQVPARSVADFADRVQKPSPVPYEELRQGLSELVGSIQNPAIRAATMCVLEEVGPQFGTSPAALGNHHAHRHGLLAHTVNMGRVALAVIPFYPRLALERDVVLAAILLHDCGKVFEYEQALGGAVRPEMLLTGHIPLAHALWSEAAKKCQVPTSLSLQVAHCILAHHGSFGSPIEPHTPEAWLVHLVDLIDARLASAERLLDEEPGKVIVGKKFSGQLIRTSLLP